MGVKIEVRIKTGSIQAECLKRRLISPSGKAIINVNAITNSRMYHLGLSVQSPTVNMAAQRIMRAMRRKRDGSIH